MPILAKIDQEIRPWECAQTDRQTDTLTQLTDANRFYNLYHAVYAIAMRQITRKYREKEIKRLQNRHVKITSSPFDSWVSLYDCSFYIFLIDSSGFLFDRNTVKYSMHAHLQRFYLHDPSSRHQLSDSQGCICQIFTGGSEFRLAMTSGAGSISKLGAQIPARSAGNFFYCAFPPQLFRGASHDRAKCRAQ